MGHHPPPAIYRINADIDLSAVSAEEVGAKAFGLMRMAAAGLDIPPAIVIGIRSCADFLAADETLPDGFDRQLAEALRWLEQVSGHRFGDGRRPLLVSVRSGAAVSMPGMLETLLNIGLNEASLGGLIRMTGNARLAWDSYRRLVRDYAEVVHGCQPGPFELIEREYLDREQVGQPEELSTAALRAIARDALVTMRALSGHALPEQPLLQLTAAIMAVFHSWNSDRAREYRRINRLQQLEGTAAIIQRMVFGNAGSRSGSGVGFTRDPATGENAMYLDFLFNAQGEDVVAGRRSGRDDTLRLETVLPDVVTELRRIKTILEQLFHDMQDFEFTVENGRLYLLQTRSGKRTPWAAMNIAMDLYRERLIDQGAVVTQLQGYDLDTLERTRFDVPAGSSPLTRAVPASIGVAVGIVAFSPERALDLAHQGNPVILVREETATEDIAGIAVARGILTTAGFRTSHAAVVARQLGKVCLVGCRELSIDPGRRGCTIAGQSFAEGDVLSLDGNSGEVYAGAIPVVHEKPALEIEQVRRWREA